MAIPETVLRDWETLNHEDQNQAAQFISLLAWRRRQEQVQREPRKTRVQFDVWKGQIELLDNFDDPLPGLEDYQ